MFIVSALLLLFVRRDLASLENRTNYNRKATVLIMIEVLYCVVLFFIAIAVMTILAFI